MQDCQLAGKVKCGLNMPLFDCRVGAGSAKDGAQHGCETVRCAIQGVLSKVLTWIGMQELGCEPSWKVYGRMTHPRMPGNICR